MGTQTIHNMGLYTGILQTRMDQREDYMKNNFAIFKYKNVTNS